MEKEKAQQYVVSGNETHRFYTVDYKVSPEHLQKIEKDRHGKYKIIYDKTIFSGEVIQKKQNKYTVNVNGNTYHFTIDKEEAFNRKAARAAESGQDKVYPLKTPMPGKICEVFVTKGSVVKKGEPLLILEAMKMQNQVLASNDARVVAIHVKKDDTVLGDQLLLELEKE